MKTKYTDRELNRMSTPRLEQLRAHIANLSEVCIGLRCGRILRNRERKRQGLCTVRIHHGPGHQSSTYCHIVGKHVWHEAVYGRGDDTTEWKGKDICTGYFDEPPLDDAIGKMKL